VILTGCHQKVMVVDGDVVAGNGNPSMSFRQSRQRTPILFNISQVERRDLCLISALTPALRKLLYCIKMVLGVVNIIMMSTMIPTMIPGLVGLTEDDKHNRRDDHNLKREDEKRSQAVDRKQPSNLQVITKFRDGSVKERLELEGAKVYVDPNRKVCRFNYNWLIGFT
jgi:hypothetical protein